MSYGLALPLEFHGIKSLHPVLTLHSASLYMAVTSKYNIYYCSRFFVVVFVAPIFFFTVVIFYTFQNKKKG